jgi:hypothetical protein
VDPDEVLDLSAAERRPWWPLPEIDIRAAGRRERWAFVLVVGILGLGVQPRWMRWVLDDRPAALERL